MSRAQRSWAVLVVDDSPEFLDAACAWMTTRADVRVVGTATNGRQALERIDELNPDVVVMDAMMPVLDGFDATRRLKRSGRRCHVVIVSFHDSATARQEAWIAGADAFVPKSDLIRVFPSVLAGLDESGTVRDARPHAPDASSDGAPPSAEPPRPPGSPNDTAERARRRPDDPP